MSLQKLSDFFLEMALFGVVNVIVGVIGAYAFIVADMWTRGSR